MLFDKVLRNYFAGGDWTIVEGQSGWNNTTRFVEAEGRKWVLRIYETHKDEDKIRYEHEILLALSEKSLPFQVPVPVRGHDGQTIVKLNDGSDRLACLFIYIEGRRPDGESKGIAYSFGVATGYLSKALNGLKVEGKPQYPPYYEMDSAHPLCMPDQVAAFCQSPPMVFAGEKEALRTVHESIVKFRDYLPQFRSLPHQLIHGDINYSNSLVSEGAEDRDRVVAILDFEFCTWDLRVMEIAVMISGFLNGERSLDTIEEFLHGCGVQLSLDKAEIEAIPLLVQLRILDVFLHFLGRYLDGVYGEEVLREQTLSAYDGLRNLEEIGDKLRSHSIRYLSS
ncbi:phosphotransferase [Cohnella luojiensis]|uniref:Aminoglycoside phosphotransferase n=1 Tax=Cohnella luojiensis TaxID=652876 RepID=A0A4Y8LNL5_9BACL|nr:phosphotransferase [Cohnella luojiensis]TFE22575.1 aminoglycoside phosphotransferase [Cohnella luojiensis]